MYITNKKLRFDIVTFRNLQNNFLKHDLYCPNDFWHKRKIYNFDPFWAVATNIPQWLKTGFVVQGHVFKTSYWYITYGAVE